jgi:DNA polymerase IV
MTTPATTPALCRDCLHRALPAGARRCPSSGSPRLLAHPELDALAIAHLDCDAFFAAVEKRDDPSLRDVPVIVGGGRRGVVSTACYLARIRGVRSAMPMFEALRLCPEARVVKPRFPAYVEASRAIRAMMEELTDRVQPLSLDEAFLDLSGTARVHGAPPAVLMAGLARRMERELGLSGSVGLAPNKFLAKIASDLDKPRGFSVIGRAEAAGFLAPRPVGIIWGIGPAAQDALARAGIRTVGDVQRWGREALVARLGGTGDRLWHLARGEDARAVAPREAEKTISNETTFGTDTADRSALDGHLWRLSEKVSHRAKEKGRAGACVQLKLKRADHTALTRRVTLREPTQMAFAIHAAARALLDAVADPGPFRLIGVGLGSLTEGARADRSGDLLDPGASRRAGAERAADAIRARFGDAAIVTGRSLR